MALEFAFRARGRDGKPIEGRRQAADQTQVVKWLRDQGMTPVSVTQVIGISKGEAASLSLWERMERISTVTTKDKAIFFRQLATMMSSGLTLAASLDILKGQTANKRLADAIVHIKRMLDSGYSLTAAMKTRTEFSSLMIAMMQAGEEGGMLDISLDRVATFLEKQEALRRKIKSALTYPTMVMLFAIGVLYLMVTVIVPKFQAVFANMNAKLPALTLFMFELADFLKYRWYMILIVLGGIVGTIVLLNRAPSTRPYMDAAKLKIPAFGDIIYKAIMARTMRTLGSLVQAGVPILSALEMAANVADNAPVAQAMDTMRDAARKGGSLGETAKGLKIFPLMAAHMIAIGEQTGRLEEMTNKVADWFDAELDAKVSQINSILEPILILFVGGIVAIVAMSIFMPIIGAIQAML